MIRDGGHVFLTCSACQAGLADIHITSPDQIDHTTNKPFEWKLRANCPFCGDKSFVKTVRGGVHIGGYGVAKSEDSQTSSTMWTGEMDINDGVIQLKIIKDNPDAKPQKVR